MADVDSDSENKKRKRSEQSSVSDLDNSVNSENKKGKAKKKKKKEDKMSKLKEVSDKEMETSDSSVASQLEAMNKKLANVISKDDKTLQKLIRQTFKEMKEELLKSVSHRIDILEGKLFEKEKENDNLKEKIESLEKANETLKTKNEEKVVEMEKEIAKRKKELNELEQYGRRNSIRIFGIPESKDETAEQTAQTAAEAINAHLSNVTLRRYDIDIAHRLGKKSRGNRPIIMKFVSRMTRDIVFRGRRSMISSNIYINEDLTALNNHILGCVRKKKCDEVDSAWSTNGKIYFKNKHNSVHEVKYEDYDH